MVVWWLPAGQMPAASSGRQSRADDHLIVGLKPQRPTRGLNGTIQSAPGLGAAHAEAGWGLSAAVIAGTAPPQSKYLRRLCRLIR